MRFIRHPFCPTLVLSAALSIPLIAAQINGTWTLRTLANNDQVDFTFLSSSSGRNNFDISRSLKLALLKGLRAEKLQSRAGDLVHFSLRPAVGIIRCAGYVKRGYGTGTFVLNPDPAYLAAMRTAGVLEMGEGQLLAMGLYYIGPSYVRQLRNSGVELRSSSEIIALRIFNVSPQYVRGLTALGYPVPPPRELIKLRIFKVDAAEIQGFRKAGYRPTFDQLVNANIFHVTPQLSAQLTEHGYGHVSIGEMVRLRMFKNEGQMYSRALISQSQVPDARPASTNTRTELIKPSGEPASNPGDAGRRRGNLVHGTEKSNRVSAPPAVRETP